MINFTKVKAAVMRGVDKVKQIFANNKEKTLTVAAADNPVEIGKVIKPSNRERGRGFVRADGRWQSPFASKLARLQASPVLPARASITYRMRFDSWLRAHMTKFQLRDTMASAEDLSSLRRARSAKVQ